MLRKSTSRKQLPVEVSPKLSICAAKRGFLFGLSQAPFSIDRPMGLPTRGSWLSVPLKNTRILRIFSRVYQPARLWSYWIPSKTPGIWERLSGLALQAVSKAVILPKDHSTGLTSTVAKTAAGALDHIHVVRVNNLVTAMKELKEKGIWIVGVETGQKMLYDEQDYRMPLALVFGNEGKGIRRLVRETCDFLVSIPTPGKIHSLNVSVSAGVVLYEVLRQRSEKKSLRS